MKEEHALHKGLEDIMEGYWIAYEQRDIEKIKKFLPKDGNILFIGTGKHERYENVEDYIQGAKREFGQSEKIEIELKNFHAHSAGKVAWTAVDMYADVTIKGKVYPLFARFTAVLELIDGAWLFRQIHLSFPEKDQAEGESFPIN